MDDPSQLIATKQYVQEDADPPFLDQPRKLHHPSLKLAPIHLSDKNNYLNRRTNRTLLLQTIKKLSR